MVQMRAKMREIKKTLKERIDKSQDDDAAKVRAKFLDRWAELTDCPIKEDGTYDYSQIDYENEFVKLEWYLCDPRILFKVTDMKYRAEGIMMLPEDVRETFYKTGPGNSKPYSELYMGMSKLKNAVSNMKKGKNQE